MSTLEISFLSEVIEDAPSWLSPHARAHITEETLKVVVFKDRYDDPYIDINFDIDSVIKALAFHGLVEDKRQRPKIQMPGSM